METNCVALDRGSVKRGPSFSINDKRVFTDNVISINAISCALLNRKGDFSWSKITNRSSLFSHSFNRDNHAFHSASVIKTAPARGSIFVVFIVIPELKGFSITLPFPDWLLALIVRNSLDKRDSSFVVSLLFLPPLITAHHNHTRKHKPNSQAQT